MQLFPTFTSLGAAIACSVLSSLFLPKTLLTGGCFSSQGIQHGGHEPRHVVSPVCILPCSTFPLPSRLSSLQNAAFKHTSLFGLQPLHLWIPLPKALSKAPLSTSPPQPKTRLPHRGLCWLTPRLSYTPFLCYHDSLWQIEFSEDGHSNISHHICSSYNITLKLLPSSGGRYVSYPWTYADLYDCLNQVR